ncbi:MAG: lipid-A-disaccharide synthase, partial [Gammaproteobacteria bacterium]|nr:lipid-A-disaccharide synthase [Gammaproteobacteria bacterium]
LFPFETAVYEQHGIPVRCVGHPLADEIPPHTDRAAARAGLALEAGGKLLALLPGSRGSEVRLLAPLFLQAADLLWRENPQLSFVIPAANDSRRNELTQILAAYPQLPVTLFSGRSREVMAAADAVLLASGTATLEAALLRRPMVVAYRMGHLSWWLLSRLVKTEYAALPNVLAGKALVPELLQDAATPAAMFSKLQPLLAEGDAVLQQVQEFEAIHRNLRQDCAVQSAAVLARLAARDQELT